MTEAPAEGRVGRPRSTGDSRRWVSEGTEVFLAVLTRTSDARLDEPTDLPGWTGKHLVAHVAANADALRNLVRWARTGEPTPMYSSPEQRVSDIEAGATRDAASLREWVRSSAAALAADLHGLPDERWSRHVRTAQGRTVPASEIPWMRAREIMVHAVDLSAVADDGRMSFADLPADFLVALVTDVVGKRGSAPEPGPGLVVAPRGADLRWSVPGVGDPQTVTGALADLTAYLTGRAGGPVTTLAGKPAPNLPPWL